MLSDSEWIEIYRHLLLKLRDVADSSLILDVERAASARIEENINEDSDIIKRFSRESREDLDPIRFRAPTPREAFTAAIGVLNTRLREVPALAERVSEKFNCATLDIQWYPDVSERDQISERGSFSAFEFTLKKSEIEQVESVLKRLKNLLEDQ
ncbi:hypothetical protein [Nostoc sp. PCC 7107]|uniref:hypothetical protein n=1 Tax=Nostoc sp. PCC 7107 TaxID=317936 RepID=UPI00029EF151|nr:hypothetical protein [Nostoc sp. PCC 7107]AFY44138.1 hypothetical protein Nos7107_3570 [Nostoc sp. PCC 7107]